MNTINQSTLTFGEIFDEAPIGYLQLNGEGRITRVNRTELTSLGYADEDMLGHYVWDTAIAYADVVDRVEKVFTIKEL